MANRAKIYYPALLPELEAIYVYKKVGRNPASLLHL